jgi:hypothetical protein
MKLSLTIIFAILIQVNLFGIERYSEGDTLFNWSTKLNFRESPNLKSKIIAQIGIGEKVIVNQNKYFKEGDGQLNSDTRDWATAITGRWVKVTYCNKKGYVFDAYLSKYNKEQIKNDELFVKKDTLRIPDYERFYRLIKENGIVKEIGIGMEWGKTVYYIPDFSIEEAIYLIKDNHIDYTFGDRNWKVDIASQTLEISENDGTSWKEITINRIENICVIVIEDGV